MSRFIHLVFLFFVFYIALEAYVSAQSGKALGHSKKLDIPDILKDTVKKVKKNFAKIDDLVKNKILGVCKKKNCKEEPKEAKEKKNAILKAEFEFQKKFNPDITFGQIQSKFNDMHRAKKKFLEINGLDKDVTAPDDGTFGIDNLLTETQSNSLITDLTETAEEVLAEVSGTVTDTLGKVTDTVGGLLGRKKRISLFFEENFAAKWDPNVPIPYTFDTNVAATEQDMVHSALRQISSVSCIKFQFVPQSPSAPHLFYTKFNTAGFCGLSYIGKVSPANPIYLSFSCPDFMGVVMHETFHALGVNHEHIRMDRDQFLTINWDNINPQQYDYFAVADAKQFTSYGVTYDYGSIMHYNGFIAAVNPQVQTMIPKFNPSAATPLMGQRKQLRPGDIELLNRMYCKRQGCNDANIYCGSWALSNYCGSNQWVGTNCPKSCGAC